MSFADTLMTPRIDAKIRSSMFKRKKSNFKDILRERFRNQIRANRHTLFGKMRSVNDSEDVQNTLSNYLRGEIQDFDMVDQKRRAKNRLFNQFQTAEPELDQDALLQLMKEIEVELLEEQLEWFMNEYRREEEEEQISFFQSKSVACPHCHLGVLQKPTFIDPISCTRCEFCLNSAVTLESFCESLTRLVDEHSKNCTNAPEFMMTFDGNSNALLMECNVCSLLCSIP